MATTPAIASLPYRADVTAQQFDAADEFGSANCPALVAASREGLAPAPVGLHQPEIAAQTHVDALNQSDAGRGHGDAGLTQGVLQVEATAISICSAEMTETVAAPREQLGSLPTTVTMSSLAVPQPQRGPVAAGGAIARRNVVSWAQHRPAGQPATIRFHMTIRRPR
jgi:hypothetical protein